MPSGMTVFNENNFLQIDQDFSNYRLISSGTALSSSMSNFPPSGNMGSYVRRSLDIFVQGSYPLVALAPNGANANPDGVGWFVFSVTESVGGWTVRLCVGSFSGIPTSCTCNYYIYNTDTIGAVGAGFGLQVFRSNGTVAYDSSYNYLKPINLYNYQSFAGYWTSTPPAGWVSIVGGVAGLENIIGKNLAIVQVDFAFGWSSDDSLSVFLARSVIGWWSHRLTVFGQDYDNIFKNANVLPLPPRATVTGRVMIVDVTNT